MGWDKGADGSLPALSVMSVPPSTWLTVQVSMLERASASAHVVVCAPRMTVMETDEPVGLGLSRVAPALTYQSPLNLFTSGPSAHCRSPSGSGSLTADAGSDPRKVWSTSAGVTLPASGVRVAVVVGAAVPARFAPPARPSAR